MANIDRNASNFFDKSASFNRRIGIYTGPAAYVANGDAFLPGEVALGKLVHVSFSVAFKTGGTIYLVLYDYTNHKAVWYDLTGTEVVAGVDLSDAVCTFEAVGI